MTLPPSLSWCELAPATTAESSKTSEQMSTHPSCGCVSRSMSVPLFTCKHLVSTYCVPDPVLTLRLHEHKATSPGAVPGEPPQSPASPPLTSQQGFSSPQASGGPSILPARPPGLPGDWHSRLGGGQGHRSWGGVLGGSAGKDWISPTPTPTPCSQPLSNTRTASLPKGKSQAGSWAQDLKPAPCVPGGIAPLSGPQLPLLPNG